MQQWDTYLYSYVGHVKVASVDIIIEARDGVSTLKRATNFAERL